MPQGRVGIRSPVPSILRPEQASVLDPWYLKALRTMAEIAGSETMLDIATSATTLGAVAGRSKLAKRAGEAVGEELRKVIRAYHGSPHDFEKFSLEKIGTGEGAQAYGHGLYFAENPRVAQGYRESLSQQRWRDIQDRISVDPDTEMYVATKRSGEKLSFWNEKEAQEWVADDLGRTYEVAIKADPDEFLDWDKPLSEQSEKVRKAISDAYGKTVDSLRQDARGSSLYDLVGHGDRTQAANALKSAGLKGIRYLDQGSRSSGQGTFNYVVFDDTIIDIMKKYGVALPVAAEMVRRQRAGLAQNPQSADNARDR